MGARRGWAAAALVAGLVLLGGGPAGAQEQDPCAPGPDGAAPVMCQSGSAGEPAPDEPDPCAPGPDGSAPLMCQGGVAPAPAPEEEDPCAPGPDGAAPELCQSAPAPGGGTDPCAGAQPVEPGDGVVTDGDGSGSSAGSEPEVAPAPEPASAPASAGDEGVVCALAAGAPEAAAPQDGSAPLQQPATISSLPRTGSQDSLAVLAAVGAGLVVAGAGAVAAARRR